MSKLPYIGKDRNGIPALIVDGKPYLMLGGEIHNSSSSSLSYMEEKVWMEIRGLHVNTLIVPVTWETVEPEEDRWDFSLVDGIIDQARREQVRLVLLWFGLWKNGESMYVPFWVKSDTVRFARACYPGGIPSNTITPLCEEAVRRDQEAFQQFMAFLKEKDEGIYTVLMVQVENEIGFLNSDRDYSALAGDCYCQKVPEELIREICPGSDGRMEKMTWEGLFGEDAAEMFMAWNYARAVERIASAGKQVYPLPMYVNAWLNQFPDRAGNYPSGGPVARNHKVWKAAARSIDLFAPDIYLSDFDGVCKEYTQGGASLLIPEARRDAVTASNVFYAFAAYHALGFSPFGIEDFGTEKEEEAQTVRKQQDLLNDLQIDELAFVHFGTGKYLSRSYELLDQMKELYFRYRGTPAVQGFIQKNEHDRGTILRLTGCEVELTYQKHPLSEPGCAGMVIEDSDCSFWIVGCQTGIRLLPRRGTGAQLTLLRMEEGEFEDGIWHPGRILNGDELYHALLGDYPEIRRFYYNISETVK
ncbi:MAG: DUF5597 domain-containing protein [Lachnospiraceae bacterium]|nr:DUF5597 domain-containing protein [Lachnospiraceae bacterium]